MNSTLYIGMGLALLSFMGFIAIVCMVGLLISVATNRGITWSAIKERLPTFLDLGAFLLMVVLLVYAVIQSMQYYGA
jgi:hypothetical protein